jgi:hypothetical protein
MMTNVTNLQYAILAILRFRDPCPVDHETILRSLQKNDAFDLEALEDLDLDLQALQSAELIQVVRTADAPHYGLAQAGCMHDTGSAVCISSTFVQKESRQIALRIWDEKIADLMNHGLNDEEITEHFNSEQAMSFIRDYCAQLRKTLSSQ